MKILNFRLVEEETLKNVNIAIRIDSIDFSYIIPLTLYSRYVDSMSSGRKG